MGLKNTIGNREAIELICTSHGQELGACCWRERELSKKKKIKTMNIKMATNSQLLTNESKEKNKNKKLSKQPEQEQNHRHGDHLEDYQLEG